ncbi:MAG: hypothetical protein K2M12_01265 [Muribaculaceae bacterium]|nr:hypothetical protein [Muribaculaceae bacterium]
MIRSSEFSIAASSTAGRLARQWLWRRWPFFVIPLAACLLAGLADVRWAIVAMMLVFIMWPMALCFVWFGGALSPDAVRASLPHAVEFSEEGIRTVYAERDGYPTPQPEFIPAAQIAGVEDTGRYVIVKPHTGSPVVILSTALDADSWRIVRELLNNYQSVISES